MFEEQEAVTTLRREHKVVEELLGRLRELGERMLTGERISPGTVRLGVGLLDAYLHRVHMRQFDVELWPAARSVAGPECIAPLNYVREHHAEIRRSTRQLLELTSRWGRGDYVAQEEVARGLLDLALGDAAINRFEEEYPFVCLNSSLSHQSQARVGEGFLRHAGTKGALETHIARFLRASQMSAPPTSGVGTPR